MTRYSLFVLKVLLNTKETNKQVVVLVDVDVVHVVLLQQQQLLLSL